MILDPTRVTELVGLAAYCRLSRSCIRFFRIAVVSQSRPLGWKDKSRLPLLHYTITFWVSRAKLGDPAETSLNDFLDCLGWLVEPLNAAHE